MPTTIERSPRTHWNQHHRGLEHRVLRNGRWVRPDAESIALRRTIFGATTAAATKSEALANTRAALGV